MSRGALLYVSFELRPISFVIADLLAACANWNKSAESLYIGQGALKFI